MRFGSVCSGIEAASVAWHPLGWKAAWLVMSFRSDNSQWASLKWAVRR